MCDIIENTKIEHCEPCFDDIIENVKSKKKIEQTWK